jgi:hypothetical protein
MFNLLFQLFWPLNVHACRRSSASALLGWASGKDLRYEQLPVEVQHHPQYGRCLVAVQDIEADEVILSVPTDRVFASQVCMSGQMFRLGLQVLTRWPGTVHAYLLHT